VEGNGIKKWEVVGGKGKEPLVHIGINHNFISSFSLFLIFFSSPQI
jgi:hypothetical protein